MSKLLSRQRVWQLDNPDKAKFLKKQTVLRRRKALFQQGYIKTHEEIWEIIDGYESRNGKVTDEEWWEIYEYLDWKYNNRKLTAPALPTEDSE